MPDVVTLPLPNFDNASSSDTHGGFSPNENVFEPLVKNAVDPHIMVEVAQPAEPVEQIHVRSCVENVNLSCDEMDLVVDNGASTHAISRSGLFSTYEISDFGVVCRRNNGQVNIIRIGDIFVETSNETTLDLKIVKHILEF
ncbi:hypothetical protein KIW84_032439 [Lathyrus oleraceus]|uniref:Retrovirus-related Pol polyprotein from transposon TNT 1-94-like beta-barrel domain-containing protein n=1 Tax=Pisum sativum TaxID=3888 RepID=A0A9D5B1V4_PEA|nr:hypothetical protein KIW84_032439 [Pisum sativum]